MRGDLILKSSAQQFLTPPKAMHIICLHASFSMCSYQVVLHHRRQFDTPLTVIAVDEVL